MRHRKKKIVIGKNAGHPMLMLKNLAVSLIMHNKIKTTQKNAKRVRPYLEKMITISKVPGLTTKRRIHDMLKNTEAEKKLINELSAKYKERKGGYTRTLKIGKRLGDNAEMVQIELI